MRRILLFALIACLMCPCAARAAIETEFPIPLDCASVLLMEPESGQVIYENNADNALPVASVNKIMTILLAAEALQDERIKRDTPVCISKEASGMGGSQALLDTGETQRFDTLLKCVIVASANDAAVAIAEALYGSNDAFVRVMNRRAEELGMTGTHFVNCTGLPAQGQTTTARDVARMSQALLQHPVYFEYSTVWMDALDHGDGRVTELTNTNRMTRTYEGCDGIKTGSTKEAGYCIAASAKRGNMRLIAIVLGAKTGKERFAIAGKLLDHGFANYRVLTVAQKGATVKGVLPVRGGDRASIPLMLGSDCTLLVDKAGTAQPELTPSLPPTLDAPVQVGQQVGMIEVVLDGRIVGSIPILAKEEARARAFSDSLRIVLDAWPCVDAA